MSIYKYDLVKNGSVKDTSIYGPYKKQQNQKQNYMPPIVEKEKFTNINKTIRFTNINRTYRLLEFTGHTDLRTSIGRTGLLELPGASW